MAIPRHVDAGMDQRTSPLKADSVENPASLPLRWDDQELRQSLTRVIITFGIALFNGLRAFVEHEPVVGGIVVTVGVYLGYSLLHLAWVAGYPGNHAARRIIGIVGDQGACTAAFLIGGEKAFPFFVVYIWVSVGNGMRFGSAYMYVATVAGAVGFSLAAWLRGFALPHFDLVLGILVSIIAIPLFVRKLFAQLEGANQRLQALALQLQHDATHDQLTGLANRAVFFDRLNHIIDRRDRHPAPCAVIYFDIDRFKSINDDYGHSVGDELLRQISSEVEAGIRKEDNFCRLAGDEFVVLIEDVASEEAAARIAATVQAAVATPRTIEGHAIEVSASIGIALYPDGINNEDARSVANRADIAMYHSKRHGRGRQTLYRPDLATAAATGP